MNPGQELLLLWAVRLSLALMCGAWLSRMRAKNRLARGLWSAGAGLMILHIFAAFAFVHGWSHADAMETTAADTLAVTGRAFGGGVWFNYAFLGLWVADASWWWIDEPRYLLRPRWIDAAIYGFLGFIAFQAAVVFETGGTRWAGVAMTVVFLLFACRFLCQGYRP